MRKEEVILEPFFKPIPPPLARVNTKRSATHILVIVRSLRERVGEHGAV